MASAMASLVDTIGRLVTQVIGLGVLLWSLITAYSIRLWAVKIYGPVIHEFDPWFNFRATEYLAEHGYQKFFKWFDYMSWYPLGRPVGTTIYPGMQMTSVAIWEAMKYIPKFKIRIPALVRSAYPLGKVVRIAPMSLNDVCVYVPAWFGSVATLGVFLLTKEVSGSWSASVASAVVMSMIPAHLMRSVAGGYDNESIAVTAICFTFFWWIRSVRTKSSWPFAILAGLSYVYMVAAWGGYIFVINMIGVHAAALVPLRLYNSSAYKAYTIFFVIGTLGAIQIPVVGWTPLKSLEQMGPLMVFIMYQLIELSNHLARKQKEMTLSQSVALRIKVFGVAAVALVAVAMILLPTGYFGPLSSRIRGLFVKHTKTGNPLVDSVAEHQAATHQAYWQYLHHGKNIAPFGFLLCLWKPDAAKSFIILYSVVAWHFSLKMVRLLIICGPITSILCGVVFGAVFDGCMSQIIGYLKSLAGMEADKTEDTTEDEPASPKKEEKKEEKKADPKAKKGKGKGGKSTSSDSKPASNPLEEIKQAYVQRYNFVTGVLCGPSTLPIRGMLAIAVLAITYQLSLSPAKEFRSHCEGMAQGMASPQILFMSRGQDGKEFLVDDYLESYKWVAANTPKDARVMAWWDYGYQITGIGQRTSIADGNTWNHEHIATLARCLVSPEKRGYKIIRHIADYVLIWAGGRGDDLAKSPHMARIGTSVYPDICPNNPTCSIFGFHADRSPTPMMAKSVVYRLHSHNKAVGVIANPKYWKEVYSSRYGLVRIYKVLNISQESKAWIADPENRICDAPGSWYCTGQYPPALRPLIEKRKDFAQLEDFNSQNKEKNAYSKYIEEENRRG